MARGRGEPRFDSRSDDRGEARDGGRRERPARPRPDMRADTRPDREPRAETGARGDRAARARPTPVRDAEPRPRQRPRADATAAPADRARPAARADQRPEKRPEKRPARARAERAPEEAPHRVGEPQRIAKLLARAGVASRREIERMIADGRVAIEGKLLDTPATVLKSLQGVTVDGKPVRAAEATRLFRFHKPAGLLTAERDPAGRPTIYDRLPPELPRVMPVGRLDLNTEGLLLLTTDGEFKRQLELPSTGVERVYRARVFGEVSQQALEELIHGIEIEGVRYGSIDANMERRTGRNGWVEMKLTEGKNREVRRVLEFLGLQVSRLIRTSYGPFPLADMPVGAVDEIRQHELVEFRKSLK